jgi:class 3 adenylate cyclase
MPASHQLAAILFTDIVSYTATMQHDEERHVLSSNDIILFLKKLLRHIMAK